MVKICGHDFTFGADPELFVRNKGKIVSAYGLVKGDKANPVKVKKGAVQVDGMALEFNIDPANSFEDFNSNLDIVMGSLKEMVGKDYEFDITPVAEFGKEYIDAQPKAARELGCSPDYDAYTGLPNERPNADAPFRTAAGHLHIGWTKDVDPNEPGHFEACRWIARVLDLYVGVPSLTWDTTPEAIKRRSLYGKAGCFRPTSYGVEYRTLSNTWLLPQKVMNKETGNVVEYPSLRRELVFKNSVKALEKLFEDNEIVNKKFVGKTAQEIIETNDVNSTLRIFEMGIVPSLKHYRNQNAF